MPYFDHMHRFFPALLRRNGVALAHVDVSHRERLRGRSKYGFWNRAFIGAVDLVGVAWLMRRKLPQDYATSEVLESEKRSW
jgi:dolichol-phosphate mannosyltransferase